MTHLSETPVRDTRSAWNRWELGSLDNGTRTVASAADAAAAVVAAAAAAEAEAEARVVAEARTVGYAAGFAAAGAERARLSQLLQSLHSCAGEHEQRLCDEVLDLSLLFARQLVGEALSVRRELVLPVVAASLKRLPQSTQRIEIFLNPADIELVRAHLAADDLGPRCRLTADAAIAAGGCRVETEQLELDMTTTLRWRRLLASLGRTEDWLELA
ncbi:MAG: flagellar assembly protein FliH [Betaproteobacteria bacterium]